MERLQLNITPMGMMDRDRKDELPEMQVWLVFGLWIVFTLRSWFALNARNDILNFSYSLFQILFHLKARIQIFRSSSSTGYAFLSTELFLTGFPSPLSPSFLVIWHDNFIIILLIISCIFFNYILHWPTLSFPWIKPLLDGALGNRAKWADLQEKVLKIRIEDGHHNDDGLDDEDLDADNLDDEDHCDDHQHCEPGGDGLDLDWPRCDRSSCRRDWGGPSEADYQLFLDSRKWKT